jgi:triphosphoribosyl-dephospho-CoA synthase
MKNKEQVAHYITALAQRAILYEVTTTPKPGLVDRNNSGAHKDMDFFTFMASSSSLYKGLYDCVIEGINFNNENKTNLLENIRFPGIECEGAMFSATNGVNTHKGIIFSIGILCSVAGYLYSKHGKTNFTIEELCEEVKEISRDLTYKDFMDIDKKDNLTHGERLFKQFGYKGIRGEVESGFATVLKTSIPMLRKWSENRDLSLNDIFLQMLMAIITESEDTNIVIRGGIENLHFVKEVSKEFLDQEDVSG